MTIFLVLERYGGEFIAAFADRESANDYAGEFDIVHAYILNEGFPV